MPTSARLATIQRIQDIYSKLTKEALVYEELEELVQLTTTLHESAVILRFKAAEERVFETKKDVKAFGTSEHIDLPEDLETPDVTSKINATESIAEIDFSIFDTQEPKEEEGSEQMEMDEINELTKQQPTAELQFVDNLTHEKEDDEQVTYDDMDSKAWENYVAKIVREHSSGLQTSLSALAGSFGLNERMLYINELFNREADQFSSAIQHLDGISDWNVCQTELKKMASERHWDTESDATGEFIIHVKRKYV